MPACSLYVLREHSCLLEERDSIVVEARKAYFSDITLAGITDGSGTTWPPMGSKAAEVFRKQVPPEQRQRNVRQSVHRDTAYGRILSGLTGRVGCEPTQGLCEFFCREHSDYRAMFQHRNNLSHKPSRPHYLLPDLLPASSKIV